jgi:hypothetical protein
MSVACNGHATDMQRELQRRCNAGATQAAFNLARRRTRKERASPYSLFAVVGQFDCDARQ